MKTYFEHMKGNSDFYNRHSVVSLILIININIDYLVIVGTPLLLLLTTWCPIIL